MSRFRPAMSAPRRPMNATSAPSAPSQAATLAPEPPPCVVTFAGVSLPRASGSVACATVSVIKSPMTTMRAMVVITSSSSGYQEGRARYSVAGASLQVVGGLNLIRGLPTVSSRARCWPLPEEGSYRIGNQAGCLPGEAPRPGRPAKAAGRLSAGPGSQPGRRFRLRSVGMVDGPGTAGTGLRMARQTRGFSQQQLAGMAGVSRQAVSAVESGHSDPSLRVALALAQALGLSVEELFGPGEPTAPVTAVSVAPLSGGPGDGPEAERAGGARVMLAPVGDRFVALPLRGDTGVGLGFLPAGGLAARRGRAAPPVAPPSGPPGAPSVASGTASSVGSGTASSVAADAAFEEI